MTTLPARDERAKPVPPPLRFRLTPSRRGVVFRQRLMGRVLIERLLIDRFRTPRGRVVEMIGGGRVVILSSGPAGLVCSCRVPSPCRHMVALATEGTR